MKSCTAFQELTPTKDLKLYHNSSTRKINTDKATELCLQDHIKSQNHFTNAEKSSRRGWRQWLLELYGKGVYRLG
jgi:hypothetical protein